VIYSNYTKFPKVEGYVGTAKLLRLRNQLLVHMPYQRHTTRHTKTLEVEYDKDLMKKVVEDRWHVYEDRPINEVSEFFSVLRKVANSDPSRVEAVRKLTTEHSRLIVFYNFNYELEKLRGLAEELKADDPSFAVAEWNGHKHEEIPDTERWLYLVQYTAGAEGWNCTTTNATAFYSLTYSYKQWHQAHGRTDRINTPFTDLYYYPLLAKSGIDPIVMKSLKDKKNFNEVRFAGRYN
jgi:hypothetical protein